MKWWIASPRGTQQPRDLLVVDRQAPWVLSMLGGEVAVRHWDELPLPPALRGLLVRCSAGGASAELSAAFVDGVDDEVALI